MENLNERLCWILCTHISEEDEPHDEDDIPDFKTRWLANLRHHDITVEFSTIEKFTIIKKFQEGGTKLEMILVLDGAVIILLHMTNYSRPTYLETVKGHPGVVEILQQLQLEPEEMYDWREVEVIE